MRCRINFKIGQFTIQEICHWPCVITALRSTRARRAIERRESCFNACLLACLLTMLHVTACQSQFTVCECPLPVQMALQPVVITTNDSPCIVVTVHLYTHTHTFFMTRGDCCKCPFLYVMCPCVHVKSLPAPRNLLFFPLIVPLTSDLSGKGLSTVGVCMCMCFLLLFPLLVTQR